MTEKILATIRQKVSDNFQFEYSPFISQNEFEKEFASFSEKLSHIKTKYENLLNTKDVKEYSQLIKIGKEEFIVNYNQYIRYDSTSNIEEKGQKYEEILNSRFDDQSDYSHIISRWLIPFIEFVYLNREELYQHSILAPLIKKYLDEKADYQWHSRLDYERIVSDLKERFESSMIKFWKLIETSDKYLKKETFPVLSDWVINVGERRFNNYRYKTENTFNVFNGGKKYSFVHKNDCKEIEDIFVTLFVLSNTGLTKISIGSEKLLQKTPYLISKDIQRIDITEGNIIEVHIHKHFDHETIVFDTDDEAYKFQNKVSERREFKRDAPKNRY